MHGRGNNGIKIVSLTLGLAVGLVLFAQVAFDLSYDRFFPDIDRLYRIYRSDIMGKEQQKSEGPVINAPVPAAMMKEFPEIEKAAVMTSWTYDAKMLTADDRMFVLKTKVADSLMFDVLGIPLLEGSTAGFRDPASVYLSESAARRIFGDSSALGKTLMEVEDDVLRTVKGVFRDLPVNSHLSFEALQSMVVFGDGPGWRNNDAYLGYVRFKPGADPRSVESRIPAMLRKYYDVDQEIRSGRRISYSFEPVKDIHMSEPLVKKTVLILWLMALSVMLIAALNYVMISISSLTKKAKMIGVHKCSGASAGNIFFMFLYETLVLIGVSFLLALLLIYTFRNPIEELIRTPLSTLFSIGHWWVVGCVLAALVIIAGAIPGKIFASVPVTQVFRAFGSNKRRWKQGLLFVQFGGVAFMFTLLLILMRQYSMVVNDDMGYDPKNIVYTQNLGNFPSSQMPLLKEEFDRYPQVVKSSVATALPLDRVSGTWINDPEVEGKVFSSQFLYVDKDYFDVMGIKFVAGENFEENTGGYDRMIVNEKFLDLAGVKGDPIGKTFHIGIAPKSVIIGVVKNYHLRSLYTEQLPLAIFSMDPAKGSDLYGRGNLVLKLASSDRKTIQGFDDKLKDFTREKDSYFRFYADAIALNYRDVQLLRNSISIAALVLFLITVIGIFGYVTDEIFNRTKEIGIRRVNGASASSIMKLIASNIVLVALPAIGIGMAAAWTVGRRWQEQFVVKAPWDAGLFLASGVFVLAVVIACVIVRSWRAANDNPVNSLRNE